MKKKKTSHSQGFEEGAAVLQCKQILKDKILQPPSLLEFEHEKKKLVQLVNSTVWNGESNSALLIGPSGCGKSTLIKNVLEELCASEQNFKKHAMVVRLNGLIHTDDRLSLLAISRQMNLENVVDDHVTGTFADNMALLLETLKGKNQAKAVIFILEEVNLFCSHHNQSLLYNLFDIAHSNKASIFVLGMTCRLNVLDLMEKRVKSRFSHRQIYLLPRNDDSFFDERIQLCKELLQLNAGDLNPRFVSEWNSSMTKLLKPGQEAHNKLKKLFQLDHREKATRDFLVQVICCLQPDHPILLPEDFSATYEDRMSDDRMKIAEGLSLTELILVVAMKHLTEIYRNEPLNFEMVFRRYIKYAKRQDSKIEETRREVVQKAFEHLQSLELVVPVRGTAGSSRVQREFQLQYFQLIPLEVRDLIRNFPNLPTDLLNWTDQNML